MKKTFLLTFVLLFATLLLAQRQMEILDRGLLAVKTTRGVFVSWRILGEEYYDTTYDLYRDGTKVNENLLTVSNFTDINGTLTSSYTVKAIVRSEEQNASDPVTVWSSPYLEIPMGRVYSRRGVEMTSRYDLNDATAADLTGDGQYEIIVKRINMDDGLFTYENDSAYCIFEAYKLDGTKLWTIDCGPNMISSGHVETNIMAFDWDMDGKAELIMQAADGTILGNGTVCGNININHRNAILHTSNMTYATTGNEYLVYMDGETASPYSIREFPLKRLESGETDLNAAWGDGYGHRSTKYFFAAPYLDGRKPSIFLARGIYTRHKMIAYDVNPETHDLTERWRWNNNTPGSPWYGQGFHNFGIADVDLDGRDEIIYGSMIIDDMGVGLSTTGLGHGDAQHCGDLDPFRWGLEVYTANENNPASTFYSGTTGQIYYRYAHSNDCGRALAANVTDQYLGSQMIDARSGLLVSSVTDKSVQTGWSGMTMNFRIFWDGDLCHETFDYDSFNSSTGGGNGAVYKFGNTTPIFTTSNCLTNNWTKGTACLQADLLGDWREEIVMRRADNMALRIYTTTTETPWRNYTLLHDMQYRQAIGWQMCGYNQPPHTSYFLGQAEGITIAPPPIMTNGRVEIVNAITTAHNNQHLILCNTAGGIVNLDTEVSPYITTINASSHIKGTQTNGVTNNSYSTYSLTGGVFIGSMRLVKQGEGVLAFSGNHTYSGNTELWGGTTEFNGALPNTNISVKRFAAFNASGSFGKNIEMEYGAILRPGGTDKNTIHVDTLKLNYGAILEFDIFSEDISADKIVAQKIILGTQVRTNGPKYNAPVLSVVLHNKADEILPSPGMYLLIEGEFEGNINNIIVEGLSGIKYNLIYEDNKLYLEIVQLRDASVITWTGGVSNIWDLATSENFINANNEVDFFVSGDKVLINDNAMLNTLNLEGEIQPSEIEVNNSTKNITISGSGKITGTTKLTKSGTKTLTLNTLNEYTGGTIITGGTLEVNTLPNDQQLSSSIGSYNNQLMLQLNNEATLTPTANVTMSYNIALGSVNNDAAIISNTSSLTMNGIFTGHTLIKRGAGVLYTSGANSHKKTIIEAGTISITGEPSSRNGYLGDTLVFNGTSGTLQMIDNSGSYSNAPWHISVPKGKTGTIRGDKRCDFTGKLVGEGTLNVYAPGNNAPRCWFSGNWSEFEGTLVPTTDGEEFQLTNTYGMPRATINIPTGVTVIAHKKNNTTTTYSFTIGQVTGGGNLGTANEWKIGSEKNFTFAGSITTGRFIKVGAGQMTVTNSSSPTSVTISEGTIALNKTAATTPMLGTGALTVAANGALVGTGLLGNSTTNINGLLRPGVSESSSSGTLKFNNKSVNLNASASMSFYIRSKTLYTKISDVNVLTLASGATITINVNSSYNATDGDEFQLWEATNNKIDLSTITLNLGELPDGFEWDITDLAKGVLRVKIQTGIEETLVNEPLKCTIITVSGIVLDEFTTTLDNVQHKLNEGSLPKGIYLVNLQGNSAHLVKKMTKQ